MSKYEEEIRKQGYDLVEAIIRRVEDGDCLVPNEDNDTLLVGCAALGKHAISQEEGVTTAVFTNGFSSPENAIAVLASVMSAARDSVVNYHLAIAKRDKSALRGVMETMLERPLWDDDMEDVTVHRELVNSFMRHIFESEAFSAHGVPKKTSLGLKIVAANDESDGPTQ